jgi:hypothetical protein
MQFTSDTPTRQRAINDILLAIPQPYVEGHTITAGEASALNQIVAENVSNNLRQKLKDGIKAEDGTVTPYDAASAQALVDSYLADYEMGVRRVGEGTSRVVDPIEREARKQAKAKARELVLAKGLKVKDVNLDEIAGSIYDANIEVLTANAKKVVAALEKAKAGATEIDTSSLTF